MKLHKQWIDVLVKQDETGMGYQDTEVTVDNGTVYKCFILNCEDVSKVEGHSGVPFNNAEIKTITVVR